MFTFTVSLSCPMHINMDEIRTATENVRNSWNYDYEGIRLQH